MSTYCAEVLSPAPLRVLLIRQRPDGFFLERLNERRGSVGTTQHDEISTRCARLSRNTAEPPIGDFVRMMSIHSSTSGRDLTPERPHISMRGGGKR